MRSTVLACIRDSVGHVGTHPALAGQDHVGQEGGLLLLSSHTTAVTMETCCLWRGLMAEAGLGGLAWRVGTRKARAGWGPSQTEAEPRPEVVGGKKGREKLGPHRK